MVSRLTRISSLAAVLVFVFLGSAPRGTAQFTTATFVGTVFDQAGEPIPNAEIALTNEGVGITRETITNPTGAFSISFLQVGEYSVRVSADGYHPQAIPSLQMRLGETVRIDFRLEGGDSDSDDTIEVDIELDTVSSSVATLVSRESILLMPLDGRNFVQLAQFLPGVLPGTPGSAAVTRGRGSIGQSSPETGVTGLSTAGARDSSNRFFLDGIEFMDFDSSSYPFSPSIEALQEMRVEVSTYSALHGAAFGAQTDLITSGGGQNYHGSLWWFNRNDYFTQSRDAIGGADVESPRLNRHQFGLNAGGPIRAPKPWAPEARSFFFFNWESGRLLEGSLPELRNVPSEAARAGDFSGLVNPRTGETIALRDPLGAGIRDNVLPATAMSPQALTLLGFTPAPNVAEDGLSFLSDARKASSTQDNFLGRIDQYFSSADQISLRYVFNRGFEAGMPFWGNDQRDNRLRAQNAAFRHLRTFSPTRINELRLGWNRISEFETFGTTGRPDYDIAGLMGLEQASPRAQDFGPPAVAINGPDGVFDVFQLQRQAGPRDRANRAFQISNMFSWQKGNHALKIGGDLFFKRLEYQRARNPRGEFDFDGAFTGSALADFMLGYVRRAEIAPTPAVADLRSFWQSYYIQDDWRVDRRMSLSIGWRYDHLPAFGQHDRNMVNIEQDGFAVAELVDSQTSRYARTLMRGDRENFGPRFGFTWALPGFQDTVLRAGWGLYFMQRPVNASLLMTEAAQERSAAFAFADAAAPPSVFLSDPFSRPDAAGDLAVSVDQEMRDANVQHWNLTLQRKVFGDMFVDLGYIGSKGSRLPVTFGDLNRPLNVADPRDPMLAPLNDRRPNPTFPRPVMGDKSVGNSSYHALQVKAQRNIATGVTLLAGYTWSKCLSGPSDRGGMIEGGSFIGEPQDIYNFAADRSVCGFDISHRLAGSIIYSIPGFRYYPGVLKPFLEGWRLGAIPTLSSGLPAPIDYGLDTTATGVPSRPDRLMRDTVNLPRKERTFQRWFDTSAFVPAQFGSFGNSPRTGAIRLPGTINADVSLTKAFSLPEPGSMEFRVEIFNVFSRFNPSPASVDRNVLSASFGTVGGGVQGVATRVIQFAVKFHLR